MSSIPSKASECSSQLADILNNNQIGKVYDLYQHNTIWHRSVGDYYGRDTIVSGYTQWLAAFPDLSYRCVDSICTDNSNGGLRLLERFEWSGTHQGHGTIGSPTGRAVSVSGLRLTHWYQDRIIAEWLQNDQLSLIRQLRMDPTEVNQRLYPFARPDFQWHAGEGDIAHTIGQTTPVPWPDNQAEAGFPEFISETLCSKIWNWRLLNAVDDVFAPNCRFDLSNEAVCEDLDGFKTYVLNRLAMSSDLTLLIDEIVWEQNAKARFKIGLRWKMIGSQDGYSSYGAPSYARFCIPGLSILETHNNQINSLVERFGEIVFSKNKAITKSEVTDFHNANLDNDESEKNK